MGTKEDNLRIGSEADLEISVGMRAKIRAHVLLRRARVNEVGFEIVSTDLESRYRLRRLLVDALNNAPQNRGQEWGGGRRSSSEFSKLQKSLHKREALFSETSKLFGARPVRGHNLETFSYFTFKKMIASVYRASCIHAHGKAAAAQENKLKSVPCSKQKLSSFTFIALLLFKRTEDPPKNANGSLHPTAALTAAEPIASEPDQPL